MGSSSETVLLYAAITNREPSILRDDFLWHELSGRGQVAAVEFEALQLAYNAISKGASGVDMGRNIFQSDCPVGMIKAVKAIVQENASVKNAFELYQSCKQR